MEPPRGFGRGHLRIDPSHAVAVKNQLKGNDADCIVSEYALVYFSHNFGFPQIGG